jgi:hypothetical protein
LNTPTLVQLDATVDGQSLANLDPQIVWEYNWTITLGNFDGDIDEVRISRPLPQ